MAFKFDCVVVLLDAGDNLDKNENCTVDLLKMCELLCITSDYVRTNFKWLHFSVKVPLGSHVF